MWNMSSHEAKRPATVQSEDFWLIRVSCAWDIIIRNISHELPMSAGKTSIFGGLLEVLPPL